MARRKSRTLTEVELEFMQVVWDGGEVTSEDITEALSREGRDLSGGTVRKMLSILEDKGYVSRRREGQSFVYKAKVCRAKATRTMVADLLKRAFGGKAAHMVAALMDTNAVRSDDVREIERLIAQRKREDQK